MKKNYLVKILLTLLLMIGLCLPILPGCAKTSNYSLPKIKNGGHTYYVSTDGSNKNAGTKAKPFKTISYGVGKLKAGDKLYIRKGTYNESLKVKKRGKKNKYISISAFKGEKVTISGKKMDSPILLDISNSSYLTVSGLTFANAYGPDSCGIYADGNTHHIVLSNNKIKNISSMSDSTKSEDSANAILLFGSSKKGIHDIWISKNVISKMHTGWGEALSVTGNCKNIYVLSNTIRDNTNIGIDFSGNYGYCKDKARDFPRNCFAANNTVLNCVSDYATSYGIYVDGGHGICIDSNTVNACSGGIEVGAEQKPSKEKYSTSNITVKNNKIKNCKEYDISVGGYSKKLGWVKNVRIENNKCTSKKLSEAMLNLSKCNKVAVTGNTFKSSAKGLVLVYSGFPAKYTKNITFKGNTFSTADSAKDVCIVYLSKEYGKFSDWLKVVGQNAACYTVKKN